MNPDLVHGASKAFDPKHRLLMTLYQFNALSEEAQQNAIWERSTFIITRLDGHEYVNLYALDAFFVELRYDPIRNQVIEHRAFTHTSRLESYLALIRLPEW